LGGTATGCQYEAAGEQEACDDKTMVGGGTLVLLHNPNFSLVQS
jgi:hypothetical protein